jgi:2'-5' RNA ligase
MRLFVAVPVPDELKERVASVGREIEGEGISLVRPGNMHLTLRFLGEVQPEKVHDIEDRLSGIAFAPFACSLRGVGAFPNPDYIRVVWAGCASGGKLEELAGRVMESLRGFGGDERFSAHLTIARVKRKTDLKAFLEKHKETDFGSFEAAGFRLVRSELGPGGPAYTTLSSFGK